MKILKYLITSFFKGIWFCCVGAAALCVGFIVFAFLMTGGLLPSIILDEHTTISPWWGIWGPVAWLIFVGSVLND